MEDSASSPGSPNLFPSPSPPLQSLPPPPAPGKCLSLTHPFCTSGCLPTFPHPNSNPSIFITNMFQMLATYLCWYSFGGDPWKWHVRHLSSMGSLRHWLQCNWNTLCPLSLSIPWQGISLPVDLRHSDWLCARWRMGFGVWLCCQTRQQPL